MYAGFMNLEKEYDKVCREKLGRLLYESGVEEYLCMGVKSLYEGSRACVQWRRVGWC